MRTMANNGWSTPLLIACQGGHLDVAHWLVLWGGASGPSGHVDASVLASEVGAHGAAVAALLEEGLTAHDAFASLVLPAAARAARLPLLLGRTAAVGCDTGEEGASGAPRGQRRSTGPPGLSVTQSPLEKLGGHESTLLAHVADFVGVPRGRTLRNMREAHEAFAEMLGDILPLQPRARGSSSSSSSGSLSD